MKNAIFIAGTIAIALGVAMAFKSFNGTQTPKLATQAFVDEGPNTQQRNTVLQSNSEVIQKEVAEEKAKAAKRIENCIRYAKFDDSTGHFFWMIQPKDFAFVLCEDTIFSVDYQMPTLFIGRQVDDKVFFSDSSGRELFVFHTVVANDPRESFAWHDNFPKAYKEAKSLTQALSIMLGTDKCCTKYKQKIASSFLTEIQNAKLFTTDEEKSMSPEDIAVVILQYGDFYNSSEVRSKEELHAFLKENKNNILY